MKPFMDSEIGTEMGTDVREMAAQGGEDAAPRDGSNPETMAFATGLFGANNERLEDAKPELVNALRELARQYREEGVVARRHEIRRIRQARLFWQGLQYAWWNPKDMNWHLPFEQRFRDDRALEEMPRYQFVTNFYQGFGLSFIAVLSQDVPSVRFYPQSAQSLEDIGAARAASDVAELVERNNHAEHLLTSIGYFLWTDGKLGAYVRYVEDGQRFGFREEQILEAMEIPLGPDVYVRRSCCAKRRAHKDSPLARIQDSGAGLSRPGLRRRDCRTAAGEHHVHGKKDGDGQDAQMVAVVGGGELVRAAGALGRHGGGRAGRRGARHRWSRRDGESVSTECGAFI